MSLGHLGLVGKKQISSAWFLTPDCPLYPIYTVEHFLLNFPTCSSSSRMFPRPLPHVTVILNTNPFSQRPPVPPMDQTQKQVWGFVSKELEKESKPENLVLWAKLQTPQPKILSSQGQHKWNIQDIGVTVFNLFQKVRESPPRSLIFLQSLPGFL